MQNIYHIYPYKHPLPINRPSPPLFSTFAKFIFQGFTSLSTATSLAIPGFRKKMRFSISPIEYRLQKQMAILIIDALKSEKMS